MRGLSEVRARKHLCVPKLPPLRKKCVCTGKKKKKVVIIARSERSERTANLILSRGGVDSKIIGVWIAVGTIRNISGFTIGVVLLCRTSPYATASVRGEMVSHMREMFIGIGFWGLDRTRCHSGHFRLLRVTRV